MIAPDTFAQGMGILADRFGRPLKAPTQAMYYQLLSAELDDQSFMAAVARVLRDHQYNTWPSPGQMIEGVQPKPATETEANEAFSKILWSRTKSSTAAQLGPTADRAYTAVGGWLAFDGLLDKDEPFLRKRFVEAYCEVQASVAHADGLALVAGEQADVTRIARGVAGTLPAMPRIAAGGGR